MTWLKWWFVGVPEWAWQHIPWHSFGGLILLVLAAVAYATVTLLTIGFAFLGVAAAAKAFVRGFRRGIQDAPPNRE